MARKLRQPTQADHAAVAEAQKFPGLAGMDLAKVVTRTEMGGWTTGDWDLVSGYATTDPAAAAFHVVAYDFGVKHNILRLLAERGWLQAGGNVLASNVLGLSAVWIGHRLAVLWQGA